MDSPCAHEHLRETKNEDGLTVFSCPDCGDTWTADMPERAEQEPEVTTRRVRGMYGLSGLTWPEFITLWVAVLVVALLAIARFA